MLFVGVFEELMTRGVLLVGLRRRLPEFGVWIASCVLFGLLHLLNALAGAGIGPTLVQVVFARVVRLDALRRPPADREPARCPCCCTPFWDFGSIAVSATSRQGFDDIAVAGVLGVFAFAVLALGVVAGGLVAWRDDRPRRLRRRWRDVPPIDVAAPRGQAEAVPGRNDLRSRTDTPAGSPA